MHAATHTQHAWPVCSSMHECMMLTQLYKWSFPFHDPFLSQQQTRVALPTIMLIALIHLPSKITEHNFINDTVDDLFKSTHAWTLYTHTKAVDPCRGTWNKCKVCGSFTVLTMRSLEKLPVLDVTAQPTMCKPNSLPLACLSWQVFLFFFSLDVPQNLWLMQDSGTAIQFDNYYMCLFI